jgi:uncharacterized protein (TIGR00290 family)
MDSKKKITISWSGGKDSALALDKVRQDPAYEIAHLHTVISASTRRVGLHGIHEDLIDAQAASMQIAVIKCYLEEDETTQSYERMILSLYGKFRSEGVTHIVFGDIFLQDLKEYRESLLKESGLIPIFPLWKTPSTALLQEFLTRGFKTILCSCNDSCYQAGLLGRTLSLNLIEQMPPGVDPCGENGEFHTFVFEGPLFARPIGLSTGATVKKEYRFNVKEEARLRNIVTAFYFLEVIPTVQEKL